MEFHVLNPLHILRQTSNMSELPRIQANQTKIYKCTHATDTHFKGIYILSLSTFH